MEVVPISVPQGAGGPSRASTHQLPFNNRNIEEWTRLDKLTGMFEKAKIETDHWAASTSSAAHKYGKVIDSRERNHPDGSMQQRQRKQMEVFQTQLPGGSMQMIRTQTVTSSSSTSWSSNTNGKVFDGFPLHVNSLDFKSEKTKGSVGRSGSIGARRPPSRPRSLFTEFTNDLLADVTARCQRLHNSHIFQTNGIDHSDEKDEGVIITEIESTPNEITKTTLNRQKSCSNENLNESDDEEKSSIRRTSRFRRSLQFPRSNHGTDDIPDWTNGKSLKERAAEIENLLRQGGSTVTTKVNIEPEVIEKPVKAKTSFVTAETLKEVRDRLRKSSDDDGIVPDSIAKVRELVSGMEAKFGSNKVIVNGTGSLESRTIKNSAEWNQRRKSYGFEKMEEKKIDRKTNIEASMDSGFGQSSETVKLTEPRFNEDTPWTRKSPLPNRDRVPLRTSRNPWLSQLRGTKLVDRDWFTGTPDPEVKEDTEAGQKKSKKVEFCKTEVHFTAEPGRFHIVETDGKPPPNNMSRRRRRPSGPENPSGLPEIKFGDSNYEKKLLTQTLSEKIEAELKELSDIFVEALPVKEEPKVAVEKSKLYDLHEDEEQVNKPVWKSTVLLRNKRFDEVSRKDSTSACSDGESELQIRFRNLKKSEPLSVGDPVRVEVSRRSLPDDVMFSRNQKVTNEELPAYSVAERIKQVENFKSNYSSKIDFRSGEMTVLQNGMSQKVDVSKNQLERKPTRTNSNPTMNGFAHNPQTTRISISIPYEEKTNSLKSSTLVSQSNDTIKLSQPVHEMIHKFDSLARPVRLNKEHRRRTMPINYKAPKEYTHADLEEELRSFTEDLDKDFKDIYEAEIECLKKIERKIPKTKKSYDSDDSDLLADEEVRSYMSAGQIESDSDESPKHKSKTFINRAKLQFQRLEERSKYRHKESLKPPIVDVKKTEEPHYAAPPKVASISLRYEDDPLFKHRNNSDRWEQLSNASSNQSDRPRERATYLNGPCLSEKYSKRGSNSSLDTLVEVGSLIKVREIQKTANEGKQETVATLDELTKAADEILVAINGLTDEESHITSSDDEERVSRKILKKSKMSGLSTISERNTDKAEPKKQLSSRAIRLIQRASNRDAMFGQRSSSEDIPANVEPVKKKYIRKVRPTESKSVQPPPPTEVCSRFRAKTAASAVNLRERNSKLDSTKDGPTRTSRNYNSERIERTKPSARRELLAKADAAAELATRSRRSLTTAAKVDTNLSTTSMSSSKRRSTKINNRRTETTKPL